MGCTGSKAADPVVPSNGPHSSAGGGAATPAAATPTPASGASEPQSPQAADRSIDVVETPKASTAPSADGTGRESITSDKNSATKDASTKSDEKSEGSFHGTRRGSAGAGSRLSNTLQSSMNSLRSVPQRAFVEPAAAFVRLVPRTFHTVETAAGRVVTRSIDVGKKTVNVAVGAATTAATTTVAVGKKTAATTVGVGKKTVGVAVGAATTAATTTYSVAKGTAGVAVGVTRGAVGVTRGAVGATYGVVKGATGVAMGAAKGSRDRLRNVFALPLEALGLDFKSYKPPSFPKSAEDKEFLRQALKRNLVFEHLSSAELAPLIDAFEEVVVTDGELIIVEGDAGDYFYVLRDGECTFHIKDVHVGTAHEGDSFGELALLYTTPRAATVKANSPKVKLYRVDQKTFRYITQSQTQQMQQDKESSLRKVDFLKALGTEELVKLSHLMTLVRFSPGEKLIKKGDPVTHFYVIHDGEAQAIDHAVGGKKYEDVILHAGDYFGQSALLDNDKNEENVIAKTEVVAFRVAKDHFEAVLGKLSDLIARSEDKYALGGIKIFSESHIDMTALNSLARLVVDHKFPAGKVLMKEGQQVEASLYILREGRVRITNAAGTRSETVSRGGYFGDDLLLVDVQAGGANNDEDDDKPPSQRSASNLGTASYTVEVVEDCVCGVLTVDACRRVVDTSRLGKPPMIDSLVDHSIHLKDLTRHKILGAGTFGQVWLVSHQNSEGKRTAYALKIQSKYELCQDGQAKAVVDEKNIMFQLQHPFLIRLVNSYQDDTFVYLLMGLLQGGELYALIHHGEKLGLPEEQSKFYASCIAEGLAYMHRRGYVYRDLKAENVLLDSDGYPVIIDFGFAKYITNKTYTLCGTPLYLAPEVILNRGHNWAADHWSLGILTFETMTGEIPFYKPGMDQMSLFRSISKGQFDIPSHISSKGAKFIRGLLTKDIGSRLGSLAGGEDDVIYHAWFDNLDKKGLRSHQVTAPYVPDLEDALDLSNFEDWTHLQDKMKMKFPKLSEEEEKIFEDF